MFARHFFHRGDRTVLTGYYRDLLNFCRRKVRDREAAADLAQESFARVLAMQQAGEVVLQPGALLRQVALRAKIDLDRRAGVRQHDSLEDLDEAAHPAGPAHLEPAHAYASAQSVDAYIQIIEALPARCREVFYLYLFEEVTNQEIADRTGLSLSMVNRHISRAKLACAAHRKACGNDA